jgi:hypothetical protein
MIESMRRLSLLVLVVLLVSCGDGDDAPFELQIGPEFVQGVIPGEQLVLLATVEDPAGAGPVAVTAEAEAGQVIVDPGSIEAGQVAEVTFVADPAPGGVEAPFTVTVAAVRGSVEKTAEVSSVIVPWQDTLAPTANDILTVFEEWLGAKEPELGITPETEFEGTLVAPNLLVVSHYAFFDAEWELGLSWHIMVAPDDWAQLYLRPRDKMAPTRAFELSSWSAALAGEPVEITEVPPPDEVTR